MEKKISTKEEQAIGWLKNEIEKDKIELESQKRQLIEAFLSFQRIKNLKKLPSTIYMGSYVVRIDF